MGDQATMAPLNKNGYGRVVDLDIAWLEKHTEQSLERDHIIAVLRDSIEFYYPTLPPGKVLCDAEPVAYACPVRCGCLWRDNEDGTMSLFNSKHQSCRVCECLPLDQLIPLYAADKEE